MFQKVWKKTGQNYSKNQKLKVNISMAIFFLLIELYSKHNHLHTSNQNQILYLKNLIKYCLNYSQQEEIKAKNCQIQIFLYSN